MGVTYYDSGECAERLTVNPFPGPGIFTSSFNSEMVLAEIAVFCAKNNLTKSYVVDMPVGPREWIGGDGNAVIGNPQVIPKHHALGSLSGCCFELQKTILSVAVTVSSCHILRLDRRRAMSLKQ